MIPEALKSLAGSVNQDIKSRGLKTEYDVTVGHILYTINTDDYNIRTDNYELDDTRFMASFSQKPRVLCRLFPGIPFFSQDSIRRIEFDIPPPPLQGASAREFFELGFLPSPWANPSMFENYPPLRMTIDIEPGTGAPHEPRIFALGSNAEVDVLYPRLPCDLRFSRRDECLLPVSSIAQESPAGGMAPLEWKRFMNDSQLNMAHDTKLRASSKLEVHIPSWLVYPGFQKLPAYASADASTDAPTDAAPNAARIEYTLTKMEYRREVAVSENASILTRTIVEGGNSGGRHTEIKLRYDPPHSSPSPLEAAPVDPHHDDDDEVSFGIEELPYDKRSPSEEFLSFVKKSVNLVTLVEDYLNRPIKQARKQAKKQAKK